MHKNRTQVPTWANDTMEASAVEKSKKKEKKAAGDDYLNFDSDESEELSEEEDEEQGASEEEDKQGVSLVLSHIKDRGHINMYSLCCIKEEKKNIPTRSFIGQLDTQFNNTLLELDSNLSCLMVE